MTVYRHAKEPCKPRKLYSISELSGNKQLGVNNADIGTLECALLTRMYYCKVGDNYVAPPLVDATLVNERLMNFRNGILESMREPTPFSYSQVLETYSGRRRTIYENALNKLTRIGLSRRDAMSIVFVKMELVNPDKAPRCIQPRDPAYNLSLGRYIKAIEHKVYKAIGKVFGDGPTVMKGYNVEEIGNIIRGKWRSFDEPVAIGLDAEKFDMHVSPAMLDWEHDIYRKLFRYSPHLSKLLKWQMNNRGVGYCPDGRLKYRVKGKRFSGDMNTGLGNCLIMSAMVWSYAKSCNTHIKLVNNGDDCVVFLEAKDVAQFMEGLSEYFSELGFRMTCESPVTELHQVEFCQMHPIEIGESCRMVRNIPATLRKDTMTTHPLTNTIHREKWCTAVGTGGLWLTGGVPVLQDFYQCYQRIGCMRQSNMLDDPTFATGMRLMSKGMAQYYKEPDPWTRVQVFEAWDISPDEQVAIERHMSEFLLEPKIGHTECTTPILVAALP